MTGSDSRFSRSAGLTIICLLLTSLAALGLAPLAIEDGYSVVEHTTSEAAGQGVEGAWVARAGFLLIGFAVLCLSVLSAPRWGLAAALLFGAFGLSMVSTAAFSSRPWQEGALYDSTEDLLHSVASSVTGVAFIVGAITLGVSRTASLKARMLDYTAALAAVGLSFGMLAWTDGQGLLQRLMFVVAYLWFAKEALALWRTSGP